MMMRQQMATNIDSQPCKGHFYQIIVLLVFCGFVVGCSTKPKVQYFTTEGSTSAKSLLLGHGPELAPLTESFESRTTESRAKGELELHFIKVGQGDCTLVIFPDNRSMLIDCGRTGGIPPWNSTGIQKYIKQQLERRTGSTDYFIDSLVISHSDKDHYNQLEGVLEGPANPEIGVGKIYLAQSPTSKNYPVGGFYKWLQAMPSNKIKVLSANSYNVFPLKELVRYGGATVEVIASNVKASKSAKNAASIVLKISYGDFDVLLPGDATEHTMANILSRFGGNYGLLDMDVLKAAHHGSNSTSMDNMRWANAVRPEAVIYSASINNRYGHPNVNLAKRFKKYTSSADVHKMKLWDGAERPSSASINRAYGKEAQYLTATNGTIAVKSNGVDYSIEHR